MSKLCIIYNFAQNYRKSIFTKIDKTWDCIWYFGTNTTDIKGLDKGLLRNETYVRNKNIIKSLKWQEGTGCLIRRKEIDRYLILGDPKLLSTWWILIQRRLFLRNKRVFLWSHGWYGRENFVKKWVKRIYFGMADHVFSYGEFGKKQAVLQGFNASKITPIHNSLDYETQKKFRNEISGHNIFVEHFRNYNPTIIFIGRLTHEKRLDLLLEAIKKLKDEKLNLNLVLIGNGEEYSALQEMTEKLNLGDIVWFYGACHEERLLSELLYNADLCVSPGNVGLTAMHSMAYGTPVLTHDNFPFQGPEFEAIIPQKTGAFFKQGDKDSLSKSIKKWLAYNKNKRDDIRNYCYLEIEKNWTAEYQIKVLKSILDE